MLDSVINIPDIHVGDMILAYLQDCKYPKANLARSLNMNSSNLSRLLKRDSMETGKLLNICNALGYNFFAHFCNDPEHAEKGHYAIGNVNLGLNIEKRLAELKMSRIDFASHLGINQSDVSRILKKNSFDTVKLSIISRVLSYNFFHDFYDAAEPSVLKTVPVDFLSRFENLTRENERLKHELEEVRRENIKLKEQLNK